MQAQEVEQEAQRMASVLRQQYKAAKRRHQEVIQAHVDGCERTLKFLRTIGPDPISTSMSLLANNRFGVPVPAHLRSKPCPGSATTPAAARSATAARKRRPKANNSNNASTDPMLSGNAIWIPECHRRLGTQMPWVVSITGSFSLGIQNINESALTLLQPNLWAHYNSVCFRTMALKLLNGPRPVPMALSVQAFGSGMVTVRGVRTVHELERTAHSYCRYLREYCNIPDVNVFNLHVGHVLCGGDFGFPVSLVDLQRVLGSCVTLDQNGFPAALFHDNPSMRERGILSATRNVCTHEFCVELRRNVGEGLSRDDDGNAYDPRYTRYANSVGCFFATGDDEQPVESSTEPAHATNNTECPPSATQDDGEEHSTEPAHATSNTVDGCVVGGSAPPTAETTSKTPGDATKKRYPKALLFESGKCMYIGLKNVEQARDLHCRLTPIAYNCRRTHAEAAAEQRQQQVRNVTQRLQWNSNPNDVAHSLNSAVGRASVSGGARIAQHAWSSAPGSAALAVPATLALPAPDTTSSDSASDAGISNFLAQPSQETLSNMGHDALQRLSQWISASVATSSSTDEPPAPAPPALPPASADGTMVLYGRE